jgi:hypothetical protein
MTVSLVPSTSPSSFTTPEKMASISREPHTPPTPIKWTPEKNYPIVQSPGGTIAVALTDRIKKFMSRLAAVYRFKDSVTDGRYPGASQVPRKRVSSHTWAFRHPDQARTPLAAAVSKNPTNFTFGVIAFRKKGSDLDPMEIEAIERSKEKGPVFNRRRGGGGGTSHKTQRVSKQVFDTAYAIFSCNYSPPTLYKFYTQKGRIRIDIPPALKSQTNLIYDIIEQTENGPLHYPGYTTDPVGKRVGEHVSKANNIESGRYTGEIYKSLAKFPQRFSLAIYDTKRLDVPIQTAEKVVIKYFKDHHVLLRNKNGGGGGGCKKS